MRLERNRPYSGTSLDVLFHLYSLSVDAAFPVTNTFCYLLDENVTGIRCGFGTLQKGFADEQIHSCWVLWTISVIIDEATNGRTCAGYLMKMQKGFADKQIHSCCVLWTISAIIDEATNGRRSMCKSKNLYRVYNEDASLTDNPNAFLEANEFEFI